jgi:tungstate transport system permease protein
LGTITEAFADSVGLVARLDPALLEIVALSLRVSLTAVLLAAIIGMPLGALLAVARFRGRRTIIVLINTLMGLPPVVVGLLVYLMLSNQGPLGVLQLLYTPGAMIVAQTILITPIIAALARQTIKDLNNEYDEQLRAFGLTAFQRAQTLLYEGRVRLATALLAGFGRAIAEVGAVIIVGGNINHVTRTMTTAIALETSRGNLALALALGLILLSMALAINALVLSLRPVRQTAAPLGVRL